MIQLGLSLRATLPRVQGSRVASKASRESGWLGTTGLSEKRVMRKQGDEDRK